MKRITALLATALFVSACAGVGVSSAEAKSQLVDALRNLLDTESYTQTMTIQSDTESLVALGEGSISEETAQKILDSSIVAAGRQADDPADAESELIVNIAGDDALEMRFVDGDLYFRAEVRGLIETFGGDPTAVDAALAQVQGRPGFEWVQPAVDGEWIVVRDALELSQQMGATTMSPAQQQQLIDDLLTTVEENATVTHEGDDDAGEHVRAALPLRETIQDLMQSLGPAAGMMSGTDESLSEIPNEDLVLDFWIDGDTVSQIGIDFTQFEDLAEESGEEFPEGVDELMFLVAIDESEVAVEPVSDATELDVTALTEALTGLMTGGMGGGTDTGMGAFDCSTLKGAPPEVIELYAEECPELQKS